MMRMEQDDNLIGRDTTMCGDPISWFPMRVIDADTENFHRKLVPAINNLIFVHSSKDRISSLKSTNAVLQPLRYIMDRTAQQAHTIMTVPDAQMQNFIRVASKTDDSVMFLNDETVVGKVGKRVLITGGVFDGVTGIIRRVKRCKRVVVELEGIASVAIAFVPTVLLKEIEN